MLEIIYFLLFITYTCVIFAFDNFLIQGLFVLMNILLLIFLKVSLIKLLKNIKVLLPIILFTSIFNIVLGNFTDAILITIKLLTVCNITFIYKSTLGITRIILTIEKILSPLHIIGISSTDISLIINIALTFIPNFIKEIDSIKISLLSKNEKRGSINFIKYTSKLLLISTFKKTNELSIALKAKGFYE